MLDAAPATEAALIADLAHRADLSPADRRAIAEDASALVRRLRGGARPGLMEAFLARYGLSTDEGLALMTLAEALLRVPDAPTVDALIADKIGPGDWTDGFGRSGSALIETAALGLAVTGGVVGGSGALRSAARRLGVPAIRAATRRAMGEMGRQFVLGQTIALAMDRARPAERRGVRHSYDMLGEAAMTAVDADRYLAAYEDAIDALAPAARPGDSQANSGISVKLSALHPRYETRQRDRVLAELTPRLASLMRRAAAANVPLTVDAEEQARLDLSFEVAERALADPALRGWDGFGMVVQGYGRRAVEAIERVGAMAAGRRVAVRLVKGAYWDAEVKRAQVEGLADYPVMAAKAATDVSYLACARTLLGMTDRLLPQFATHNAHTAMAVLRMAGDRRDWEFQRLHGMGEALHDALRRSHGTRLRVYAPVGRHRELLAYLVRRLLENGANASFVAQLMDEAIPPEAVAADPWAAAPARTLPRPAEIFAPRVNSAGHDIDDPRALAALIDEREAFRSARWKAAPVLAAQTEPKAPSEIRNPADPGDLVGTCADARPQDVARAAEAARPWDAPAAERARILRGASDALEDRTPELLAVLAREAGKTLPDGVAEIREAVDFLRYYAGEAERLPAAGPRGTFACIAPWNFPLAIFCGQVAAALAAGNAVLAKPAEATPLVAAIAVRALHAAGVPRAALQFLPGPGGGVGRALSECAGVDGIAFTGSTATARAIHAAMARHLPPAAPLIAETGGINAMVVDSTALPEQAVADAVASAFQSAGQRCSALRVLCVQEDVADALVEMLVGATAELRVGDPWDPATDVGPIITAEARDGFAGYVAAAEREGRLIARGAAPDGGAFLAPAIVRVDDVADVTREVFAPVLHVATFRAGGLDALLGRISATGYGLTFGLHTRLAGRAERVAARVPAGNVYVNRNQIGAVVGSQPFGGEGLSGTGPKAGGPAYVPRFAAVRRPALPAASGPVANVAEVARALAAARAPQAAPGRTEMPGPTGEANVLATRARGTVLCLGPTAAAAAEQAALAARHGCPAVRVAPDVERARGAVPGVLDPDALIALAPLAAVLHWGDDAALRSVRRALAERPGAILPLIGGPGEAAMLRLERHVCTDTTAAGGDAALLTA